MFGYYDLFFARTSSGSVAPSDMPVHIVEETRGDDITFTRPWGGDYPPRSIYADSVFVRRDDGIWCKRDTVGRLCLVNINGERCAKPRKLGSGLDPNDGQRRPSSISPHVWWRMMTKAERSQWWLDFSDARSATKCFPSAYCSPIGISSLLGATSRSTICTWSPLPANDSDVSTGLWTIKRRRH